MQRKRNATRDPAQQAAAKRRRTHLAEVSAKACVGLRRIGDAEPCPAAERTPALRRVSVHGARVPPYPFTSAKTVVAIRIAAKRRLTIRDATGSRRRRDRAAPARSQNRWITTIMIVSTADLSSASRRRGSTGSVVPANTAAIAR